MGKIKHQRKIENLDLFIYEKLRTPEEKQHNKDTLKLAEAIKSKCIVEVQSGKYGFSDNTKVNGYIPQLSRFHLINMNKFF